MTALAKVQNFSPETRPYFASWKKLLAIYLVLPSLLLLAFLDLFLWNGYFRTQMSTNPDEWLAFRLIFVLPHIFAGNFLLADREYFNYYGRKVLIPGLIIAVGLYPLLKLTLGTTSFWIVFDIWTIWHAWSQQSG